MVCVSLHVCCTKPDPVEIKLAFPEQLLMEMEAISYTTASV